MSTSYPSDLTDAEWDYVQRYLPALPRSGRPRTHPLRRILDAIIYVVRPGCAWRFLPRAVHAWGTGYASITVFASSAWTAPMPRFMRCCADWRGCSVPTPTPLRI